MSYAPEDKRDCLFYHLLGVQEHVGTWGHEYVRYLASEIIIDFHLLTEKEESTTVLKNLALDMVPFFLKHNAEADACDLLLELEMIEKLTELVDKDTYSRVCLYILR